MQLNVFSCMKPLAKRPTSALSIHGRKWPSFFPQKAFQYLTSTMESKFKPLLIGLLLAMTFANYCKTKNPYFLDEESFKQVVHNKRGFARLSPRFSQVSDLFRGIDTYRLAEFQAEPNTFLLPYHFDADHLLFIVRGKGTMVFVQQQGRESYNLERGDIIRVPAGTITYSVNRDNIEKFQIVSLFHGVSPSGSFQEYFGAGGRDPVSFYNTFSDQILMAAFNTTREKLDRVFRQQNKGMFIEATREQIMVLTRDASSSKVVNIFRKHPTLSNEYGQLYEVNANDYRELKDLDISVTFHNITKGAMIAPFYNSRAITLAIVVDGRGYFEMACPHLSSMGRKHYRRVSAHLSPRVGVIVPAGHPVSVIASNDQNLEIVAFQINAENNQRNYLAGQDNLLNKIQSEAKELSFGVPIKEVEEVFNNQRHSAFLPGPDQC